MPSFQPEAIFETLNRHGVRYLLVGGLAATLHGSTLRTGDTDICPARDLPNLKKLAAALSELQPRLRAADTPEGVRFPCDSDFFSRVDLCNLTTVHGDVNISFKPSGTAGFDDLVQRAVTYDLGNLTVPVTSLDDVIRSKRAANRAKDRAALPELEALRDEIKRRGKPKR